MNDTDSHECVTCTYVPYEAVHGMTKNCNDSTQGVTKKSINLKDEEHISLKNTIQRMYETPFLYQMRIKT